MNISARYDRTGRALYRGGFADVWRGKHHDRDVAIKVLRTYSDSDLRKIVGVRTGCTLFPHADVLTEPVQRFCKEVVTWKTLRHPNVLPLIGVMMSEAHFAMVSDWMVNGNINDFVKEHPDVNRLDLVGCSFNVPRLRRRLIDDRTE